MATTKKLRETYGLTQKQIALFIGVSRFQICYHENNGNTLPDSAHEVLKRVYLLYQQYGGQPAMADTQNVHALIKIEEYLNKQILNLKYRITGCQRKKDRLQSIHVETKLHLSILIHLMGELSLQEGLLWDSLLKLSSELRKSLYRTGPEKQLKLSIMIEASKEQITVYERFLEYCRTS